MLHHNLEWPEYKLKHGAQVKQMDEANPIGILRETITFEFTHLRDQLQIEVHHLYPEKLQVLNEQLFDQRMRDVATQEALQTALMGAKVLASHLETTRSIS